MKKANLSIWDTYEGQWKDDKTNGYGTYIHKDGASYIRNWADNH